MAGSALGPRVLLKRLREVMAEPVAAQKRLDKIVKIIAANMVAEVCSIYVMRPGDVLELYATEGLKGEAVHKSKLKTGEGLVGTIAERGDRPQPCRGPASSGLQVSARDRRRNLSRLPRRADHARRHGHRRAGGAEPHAAPLHRGGRRGAADHRHGAGRGHRLGRACARWQAKSPPTSPMCAAIIIRGDSLAEGVALGHVVLHEPRVVILNLIAENVPAERKRLEDAIHQLRTHVDELLDGSDAQRATEYSRCARNHPHVRP